MYIFEDRAFVFNLKGEVLTFCERRELSLSWISVLDFASEHLVLQKSVNSP